MARRDATRFDVVLRVRKQVEDRAKRTVAERLRGRRRAQEHREMLAEQMRTEFAESRGDRQEGALDVCRLRLHRHWQTHLQHEILDAQSRVDECDRNLATDRAALTEATRSVKIIEKLQERITARQRAEQRRRETAEADEVALRIVRRRGGSGTAAEAVENRQ